MRIFRYFLLVFVLGVISRCETDVDLGAEYKKIPIVFGLLDVSDTLHYVKITKAFGGQGNSIEIAQVADSSYFNSVDAQIMEVVDAQVVKEYQLRDTTMNDKEEGAFYNPDQKVYYFKETNLNPDATYRLVADMDEGDINIEVETKLVPSVSFDAPPAALQTLNFATPQSSEDDKYNSTNVRWVDSENAALYSLSLSLVYTEVYSDGSSKQFKKVWGLGNSDESDVSNGGSVIEIMRGKEFYQWVSSNVPIPGDNLVQRKFDYARLNLSSADQKLKTYIEVSEPVTGIVQNKPNFTNIDGGRGVFASRNRTKSPKFRLNRNSMGEFCEGQYTGNLLFCSDYSGYSGESWSCN